MKKLFTLIAGMLCAMAAQAQEFNMFNKADVDENGWLWFNSQAIVDKYVGFCEEEDYKVDPNGKLIQLVYADQMPSYPAASVDPAFVGAGTDGELNGKDAKTGALILPGASASMSTNGGGFVVLMPSCTTFSICLSCEGNVYCQLLSTDDVTKKLDAFEVRKAYSMFNKFAGAGLKTVTGLESVTNGYNNITIKSDKPVYAYFRSLTKNEIYIHGIKVTTPRQESTGIDDVKTDEAQGKTDVYTLGGMMVGHTTQGLKAGVYVVKTGSKVEKVIID